MMDPDRLDGDDDSEEEEDWMDTHWDTIQDSSSKPGDNRKEADGNPKGDAGSKEYTSLMTRMQLNDCKAGMQGLDKEHINQVIYEASKGSRFFENERQKEEQVQLRIQQQERQRRTITDSDLHKGMIEADKLVAELNASRDLSQTIVHVDMDAFYAAVEMRENPSLRNKPMAVGGIGMLSTSNYEARKYGVRAAMPGFIGKKLCPQLVIVPASFPKYREVSEQVRQIFADYDPSFCPMSLDEAYLNFTEHVQERHHLSTVNRSFLRRCQTPADPSLCRCDLNETIRDAVFKDHDAGKAFHSATDHKQKQTDINGNSHFKDSKANASKNDGLLSESEEQKPETIKPEHYGALRQTVTEEFPSCSTLKSGDGLSVQRPPEVGAQGSRQGDDRSQCPSCGKTLPPFEVVTFGMDVESAVHEMRCRIEQRTCLTASAGIAPNMMLSKVCSDQNKPNGQFFLSPTCQDVMDFVHNLPVRKISGIGRVTEQLLGALGISTCSDLFEKRALLYHLYSSVSFSYFMRVARGIGSTQVARASEEERKSMSTEQTFGELSQPEELYGKCWELCQQLAEDLAKEELKGKTISLKLKTTDFQVRTRAQTISNYTSEADLIFSVAKGILRNEILAESPRPLILRLMGVRMSKLVAEGECPQEKQNSILGFLKKTPLSVSCGEESSTDQPTKDHRASSPENNHKVCKADRLSSPSQQERGIKMSEENRPLEASSNVNVKKCLAFADHASRCTQGGEGHASDVAALTALDKCSMDENYDPAPKTQGVGKQFKDSIAAEHKPDLNVSDENVEDDASAQSEVIIRNSNTQKRSETIHSEMLCTEDRNGTSFVSQKAASESSASTTTHTPSVSRSQVLAEVHVAPSTSSAYDMDDEIISTNELLNNAPIHSSVSVTQPFTCPVCCKPVGCINLTDFNAHIDRCLQPESQQPASFHNSAAKTPSANKASVAMTSTLQKPKSSQNSSNTHSARVTSSAEKKKPRHISGGSSKPTTPNASVDSGADHPSKSRAMNETIPGCSSAGLGEGTSPASASHQDQQENCELGSVDYMVCPLCGAERADWNLDTFNHHVDACLNRDTISQILREQQTADGPSRKRPATDHQEELKSSQQGKKTKKSQSPKTERSILSFFKR